MIHFVIYEYLKKELAIMQNKKKNDDKTTFDFVCFMLCGACSKTCATIVAYPHGKNSFLHTSKNVIPTLKLSSLQEN